MRRQLFFGLTWLCVAILAVALSMTGTDVVRNAVTSSSVTQYASGTFSDAMSLLGEDMFIADETITEETIVSEIVPNVNNDANSSSVAVDISAQKVSNQVSKNVQVDPDKKTKKKEERERNKQSLASDENEEVSTENSDDSEYNNELELDTVTEQVDSAIEWVQASGGSAFVRCSESQPRIVGWNVLDGYAFAGIATEVIDEQKVSKVVFTSHNTESIIVAQCDQNNVIYEVTETQIALSADFTFDDTTSP